MFMTLRSPGDPLSSQMHWSKRWTASFERIDISQSAKCTNNVRKCLVHLRTKLSPNICNTTKFVHVGYRGCFQMPTKQWEWVPHWCFWNITNGMATCSSTKFLQGMKYGFRTTPPLANCNQWSGVILSHQTSHTNSNKLHQPENWWPLFSGTVKVSSLLISCPATQPSMLMSTVLHFDVFIRLFRTAAEVNSHMALFWSMTMHAHILPGWHRPCCVMNSIGTHSTILHTVPTWHHRTFTSSWRWRSTLRVNDMQMMRTCSTLSWTGWIARRPSGTRRE